MTVTLERVTVTLGGRRVVDVVDASVPTGGWLGLVGPNGAGKTTLLRSVVGTVDYGGRVLLDGDAHFHHDRRASARAIAYVPQRPMLPHAMTVGEYVMLGRTPHLGFFSTESRSDRSAVASVLDRLELGNFADRALGEISGGEAQRAVLARALVQEAPVLVMDEPTAGLDLGHGQQVLELTDALRVERGLTVISAMHDLTIAGQYAHELLVMVEGKVVASGPASRVLTEVEIGRHFAANVRVFSDDDAGVVVAPARPTAARSGATAPSRPPVVSVSSLRPRTRGANPASTSPESRAQ